MQNLVQPFVDWTNANLEIFSRFAKSPEIAQVTKNGLEKYLEFVQETLGRIGSSDALAEWNRAAVDNYARFVNDYTQSVYAIVSQSQDFISRQVQQSARRLELIGEATDRAVDAGADAVRRTAQAGEELTNEAADTAEQAGDELKRNVRAHKRG
jgi:hypothetical protein